MADETTIAAGVDLSVNVQNALKGIQAVDKATSSMITSFQKVSDQVDAVIQRIENLTAVAAKANQTVNHINNSTNNSTNYNHTVNTGGIPTVSTKSGTFAMPSGGRNPKFRQAEDEFLRLQKEEVETQREITRLNKSKADTLNEELKYIKQTKDTAAKNAQARADTAAFKNSKENKAYFQALADKHNDLSDFYKYKSAHPDMFAAGALLRSPRYQFGKAFEGVGAKVGTFGVGSDKLEGKAIGGVISAIGTLMKSPVAGGAAALMGFANGILEVGKAATQAYAEIESIRTQLGVVFSSQTQADSMFGELAQYATKSPFGVQQTSELAILLKQSGVYASDLMDTLKMIGDTAGGNMEKMKRIANNYAQIVSIGKASMLDMRQFAYAGIPIFEAVSKELGVSQQELRKLISDGKVTSDIIEKVFKDLTGINGIFENATEKGAKTLKARLQNLADAKQLAMSEGGQWLTSYGTRGNDSYANQIVTGLENIFSWLQEKVSTVNIEKSVRNIEDRNSDIQALETLLEISKKNGDTASQAAIEKMITTLISKGNVDEERNIYAKSYDKKYIDYETNKRTVDSFGHNMLIYGSYENLYNAAMGEKLRRDAGGGYNSEFRIYSDELLEAFIQSLENLLNAEERNKSITNEERLANIERNTLNAQSLAYDNANKSADATGSLNSSFDELASIFEKSKEQQQKKEEEKIKLLKSAQDELKKLAVHADENGRVDILSFSRKEFSDYLQKGAFKAVGKLTSVKGDGKSERQMVEDRPQLLANYKKVVSEIDSEIPQIKFNNKKVYQAIENLDNIKDNRTFYEEFNKFNDGFLQQLKKLQEEGLITKDQQDSFANSIAQYMNKYELRVGGQFADLNALKEDGKSFIPLWKRILAENTGLTTEQMRSTRDTLDNYMYNMSVRSSAKNVGSALLSHGGLETFGRLMGQYESTKQLEGDASVTRQIDWKAVKNSLHDFATSLSASTDIINAYTQSLDSELDVYKNIVTSGLTQAESQGLKSQRTVSAKKLTELAMAGGDQLVNAFDVGFKTESGQEVYLHDDGKWYDAIKGGNQISVENLQVTNNLFDWLKENLPALIKKNAEAKSKAFDNAQLASMLKSVKATMLSTGITQSQGVNQYTGYALNNSEYLSSQFDAISGGEKLRKDKNGNYIYKEWAEKPIEDILVAAQNGNKEAATLIAEVFKQIENSIKHLVDTPEYKALAGANKTKTRDDALNKAIMRASGQETDTGYDIWKDTSGSRKVRNWFAGALGYDKPYDIEDAYIASAKQGAFGLDKSKFEGMSNEDILKELSFTDKLRIDVELGLEDAKTQLAALAKNITKLGGEFASEAFTSSMETWGEALASGADSSEALAENMKQLSAGLMKNLGSMITQAGLSLAISSVGNMPMVLAGLAIAAAGGGMSFLGGMLGAEAESEEDEKDNEYEKLLKIKEDLSDLLKQAREDAIYYEKTVRHQNALSTNGQIGKVTSVNDAIITPSGDVISTHPDDYLIATKTPQTLIGGHDAPTVNFSVIDKSTGIKVTQQKSTYNRDNNTIDFEAIIESKVKEIIASPTGDEAFNAREYRIHGKQYVG